MGLQLPDHRFKSVSRLFSKTLIINQSLLCSLFHKCSAETLLELLENKMYLGATLGIIQVLHTWGQELNYYPYIHCINILLIPKEL